MEYSKLVILARGAMSLCSRIARSGRPIDRIERGLGQQIVAVGPQAIGKVEHGRDGIICPVSAVSQNQPSIGCRNIRDVTSLIAYRHTDWVTLTVFLPEVPRAS